MICENCKVIMKNGTSYERKKGRYLARSYNECPKCHCRKYNYEPNFQELLGDKSEENREKIKKNILDELKQGKYVSYYCNDYNKELKKIVFSIVNKFGGISQKDYDDFISIAAMVVWDCEKTFDESKGKSFKSYFMGCLYQKVKMQMTYKNRKKRTKIIKDENGNLTYLSDISINVLINEDADSTIEDMLKSDFDLEKEVFGECYSEKMITYLNHLSKRQKHVLKLLSYSYKPSEIQRILHITQKEYLDALTGIHSYESISILFR